jgi:hypothetical protein
MFWMHVSLGAERLFSGGKRRQRFTPTWPHTPHDATCSDDLDFWNAANADLDRNAWSSAFVCSLSRQHCFTFQRLGLSGAIDRRDADGAISCLPGKRNPV